jgi:uncharacterized glyoxalase superfamily protein PhnB
MRFHWRYSISTIETSIKPMKQDIVHILNTDDFWRDYKHMVVAGIHFARPPAEQEYDTVAVFEDLYGNLWDLLQLKDNHPISSRLKALV